MLFSFLHTFTYPTVLKLSMNTWAFCISLSNNITTSKNVSCKNNNLGCLSLIDGVRFHAKMFFQTPSNPCLYHQNHYKMSLKNIYCSFVIKHCMLSTNFCEISPLPDPKNQMAGEERDTLSILIGKAVKYEFMCP